MGRHSSLFIRGAGLAEVSCSTKPAWGTIHILTGGRRPGHKRAPKKEGRVEASETEFPANGTYFYLFSSYVNSPIRGGVCLVMGENKDSLLARSYFVGRSAGLSAPPERQTLPTSPSISMASSRKKGRLSNRSVAWGSLPEVGNERFANRCYD